MLTLFSQLNQKTTKTTLLTISGLNLIILAIFLFVGFSATTAKALDDHQTLSGNEKLMVECIGRRLSLKRISPTEVKLTCKPNRNQPTATAAPATDTPMPPTATNTAVPTEPTQQPPTATNTPIPPTATAVVPTSQPADGIFTETFDINPDSPTSWQPDNWDVTVHSRDYDTWYALEPMQAHHGPNCEAPPATHTVTAYEDTVFNCKNHMMTALNASGYGTLYLTPNHLIDFSQGEAVFRYDMSTLRTVGRDWVDIWVTPYEDHLQLPLADWFPDLSGEPKRGFHIEMSGTDPNETEFILFMIENHQPTKMPRNYGGYEEFLTQDAKRRDTFELRVSQNRIRFGMPDYDWWWIDQEVDLDWSQGVIQIGHHSYNPTKGCSGPTCGPNTYHWDNFYMEPAVPFTMLKGSQRYVDQQTNPVVQFNGQAPANSHLRFAGIGDRLEVSFDGGNSWQPAQTQTQIKYETDKFWSYWMPVPEGTSTVHFRDTKTHEWMVRDITIWSRTTQ